MKNENGYFVCNICGKAMYDRSKYITVRRFRTVDDAHYTKQKQLGKALHIHDECWKGVMGFYED